MKKIKFAHYEAFDMAEAQVAAELKKAFDTLGLGSQPLKFTHYDAFTMAEAQVAKEIKAFRELMAK